LQRMGGTFDVWDPDGLGTDWLWLSRGYGPGGSFLNDVFQTNLVIGAQVATLGDGAGFGVSTVFNNDLWIGLGLVNTGFAGSYAYNMWKSPQGPTGGAQWDIEDPITRYPTVSFGGDIAVLDNHMFLYRSHGVINSRSFWSSPDGKVWTKMENPNPPKNVIYGQFVAWNGKLFLFGTAWEDNNFQVGEDIVEITPVKGPVRTYEGFYIYEKP